MRPWASCTEAFELLAPVAVRRLPGRRVLLGSCPAGRDTWEGWGLAEPVWGGPGLGELSPRGLVTMQTVFCLPGLLLDMVGLVVPLPPFLKHKGGAG